MRRTILSIIIALSIVLVWGDMLFAAHILEPLGTEIAATPPRGRTFVQVEYVYSNDDPDGGENIKSHALALEFEIGVEKGHSLTLRLKFFLRRPREMKGRGH